MGCARHGMVVAWWWHGCGWQWVSGPDKCGSEANLAVKQNLRASYVSCTGMVVYID
jgi:hypothetical protein